MLLNIFFKIFSQFFKIRAECPFNIKCSTQSTFLNFEPQLVNICEVQDYVDLVKECLLHRSSFRHQIAEAPAAYYIAFFSLIQFKCSTLTHQMQSPDSVVVSTLGCRAKGWGIDSH